MPERPLPIRTPEASNLPQFKFAYVVHDGLKRANETWEMIKDCDIILQEEVSYSEDERNSKERMVALATNKSGRSKEDLLRLCLLPKRPRSWHHLMLAKIIESGKELHYIDVLHDSPAIKIRRIADILREKSLDLLHKGQPLLSVGVLEKSVEKYALSNRMRTEAVLTQILQLRNKEGKNWNGKRIGVVQGAVHEPTSIAFKTVFPEYLVENEVMETCSPALDDAVMKKELFPDRRVDQMKLIITLFSDGIIYNYLKLLNPKKNDSIICDLADKIGVSLTPEEVDQYWQMIIAADGKRDECQDRMWDVANAIGKKWKSKQTGLNG